MYRVSLSRPAFGLRLIDSYLAGLGAFGSSPPAAGAFRAIVMAGNGLSRNLPLKTVTGPSGQLLCFNETRGEDGIPRRPAIGPGARAVLLEAEYFRPAVLSNIPFPGDGDTSPPLREVHLDPGVNYPFPSGRAPSDGAPTLLRGVVRTDGGSAAGFNIEPMGPLKGRVQPYRTGPDGQWMLVFPSNQQDASISYRVVSPSGQSRTFRNVSVTANATATAAPYQVGQGSG